jgi:hypothetical protein
MPRSITLKANLAPANTPANTKKTGRSIKELAEASTVGTLPQ